MIESAVKLTQFYFTGETKSGEIAANFTSEIRTVKLGVFSFSPIAPVCGAVKLGGDIYRRYILPFLRFSTGAKGAVGSRQSPPNSPLHLGGAL